MSSCILKERPGYSGVFNCQWVSHGVFPQTLTVGDFLQLDIREDGVQLEGTTTSRKWSRVGNISEPLQVKAAEPQDGRAEPIRSRTLYPGKMNIDPVGSHFLRTCCRLSPPCPSAGSATGALQGRTSSAHSENYREARSAAVHLSAVWRRKQANTTNNKAIMSLKRQ